MQGVLNPPEEREYKPYAYSEEERRFVSDWWDEFLLMHQVKNQPVDMLGGRTLQAFWDDSTRDYAVVSETVDDPNDPVQQYVSSVSRDKSDVFINNLVGQLQYPSVKAFNSERESDKVLGRASRSLLEWAHLNDGYPSENGTVKSARYVHKMVVEGTVHVLDEVHKECGLTSSLVPNEEIFVPNFWEHDIQNQSHLIRAQLNVTWENAERAFGHLPNWEFVSPQFSDWSFVQRPEFKQVFQGIIMNRRVQVMHVWKDMEKKQLEKEKNAGRLPQWARRGKYYNVLVNDIPMYPVDNISPYKDGMYPINKGVFSFMAKPEFYWGNSLPNKIRQDKRWLDAWKTLLRFKGKLNALPPMVSLNGNYVDEEILIPNKITPITDELDLKRIDGVADPVNQSEVMLLNMAESEIDRGSVAPTMAGQMPTKRMTKGEVLVSDANAKKLLDGFSLQVGWLMQARSFPILLRLFQFLPRGEFKKISVPEQTLWDGSRGNMEILFKKIPKMFKESVTAESEGILAREIESRSRKNPVESVTIDPEYARNAQYYLVSDAANALEDKGAMKKMEFAQNLQLYLSRPDLWNAKAVARRFVRLNDDPDELLSEGDPVSFQAEAPIGSFGSAQLGNLANDLQPMV